MAKYLKRILTDPNFKKQNFLLNKDDCSSLLKIVNDSSKNSFFVKKNKI